jgi:hypothetical protein
MLAKLKNLPLKVALSALYLIALVAVALVLEPVLVAAAASTLALIYSITTLLTYWNDQ